MKPDEVRDRAVEALLRRSLRAEANAPVSADCLDAETLAAWVDHGLEPEPMQRTETHLSTCARCQALVATVVQATPPTPIPAAWWQTWNIRWLVPLTAGLAAVALWAVIPNRPLPQGVNEQGQLQARAEPSASAAPADLADRIEPAPNASAPERPRAPLQETAAAARAKESDAREAPVKSKLEAGGRRDESRESEVASLDRIAKSLPAEKKVAEAPAGADERAAAPPPAPAATVAAPAAPSPPMANAIGQSTGRLRQAVGGEIASPDPRVRWRLGAAGGVEATRDGGATWEAIATGVTAQLLAGSSPSRTVCWFVGRDGAVVVTSDGLTWRRAAFPEKADLVAVQATDARTATVVTSDGRSFRTSDGGATWQPLPR